MTDFTKPPIACSSAVVIALVTETTTNHQMSEDSIVIEAKRPEVERKLTGPRPIKRGLRSKRRTAVTRAKARTHQGQKRTKTDPRSKG